jgi:hypothetical protein
MKGIIDHRAARFTGDTKHLGSARYSPSRSQVTAVLLHDLAHGRHIFPDRLVAVADRDHRASLFSLSYLDWQRHPDDDTALP